MSSANNDVQAAEAFGQAVATMRQEIGKAIVGQHDVVDRLVLALFCRGHALLVGVPGLAKTLLVSTVADTLRLAFNRIQFTPDLMPSDILGTEVLEIDQETGRRFFKFVQGPVFANLVLADEINRTPPKTQAALLEAMQEKRVTIGGQTTALPNPFFVLATQNPIEQEGTYPLPEAQLDRFMFSLKVDYPNPEDEMEIVRRTTGAPTQPAQAVLSPEDIVRYQDLIRQVPVPDNVTRFAVELVGRSRPAHANVPAEVKELIAWGAGPRASQYLVLGAKGHALMAGRYSPDIEDVRAIALPTLRHRIVPSFNAEADGIDADAIVEKLLALG